jgi:methyl-accepting chemotaxis protein
MANTSTKKKAPQKSSPAKKAGAPCGVDSKMELEEARANVKAVFDVLEALHQARTPLDAAKAALDVVRVSFGWAYGSYWTVDPKDNALHFACESGSVNDEFRRATVQATFREGEGLSGRAWRQRDIYFVPEISQVTDCCRAPVAARAGVHSGLCFPVLVGQNVVGTMDFFALEVLTIQPERYEVLRKVGRLVSQAIDRMQKETETARVTSMMEQAPINVMFADREFKIQYINPASIRTLKGIEKYLPIKPEQMLGQVIDIFHKRPEHQRKLLSDTSNLPIHSKIQVGPETLDLLVSPIYDQHKNYLGAMVTWEVITQKLRLETEMARVNSMMEQAPVNVMFADRDFKIQYLNPASTRTLKTIEQYLPVKPEQMLGQVIDVFHKRPEHQRRILSDPKNLPIQSQIQVGPETLDLLVSPIYDNNHNHLGAMVTWEVITKKLAMERQVKDLAEQERKQAEELRQKVDKILACVNAVADGDFSLDVPELGDDAIGQVGKALGQAVHGVRMALSEVREVANTVAAASQQLTAAAEGIASGAQEQASSLEEKASSLEEITATVKQNTDSAQQARQLAGNSRDVAEKGGQVVGNAVEAMGAINQSSKKIADIITAIDEIAFQTNLLALNAAVEAARAGEQGRGFAVVAAEVRNLAQRSATAAKEIKSLIQDSVRKVENGSELVNRSGQTLQEIVTSVKRVTDIVTEIAAASKEQSAGIDQVNKAVTQMDRVTQANASQTEEMSSTAQSLLSHAEELQTLVSRFKLDQEVGGRSAPARSAAAAKAPAKGVLKKAPAKAGELKPRPSRPEPVAAGAANGHSRSHELDKDGSNSGTQDDGFQEF